MWNDVDIEMAEATATSNRIARVTAGGFMHPTTMKRVVANVAESLFNGWVDGATEGVLVECEDNGYRPTPKQFDAMCWQAWDAYEAKEAHFDRMRD